MQFCDLFNMYDAISERSLNEKFDLDYVNVIFIDASSYDLEHDAVTFHADYYVNSVELQEKYDLAFIKNYSVLQVSQKISDTETQQTIYVTFVAEYTE